MRTCNNSGVPILALIAVLIFIVSALFFAMDGYVTRPNDGGERVAAVEHPRGDGARTTGGPRIHHDTVNIDLMSRANEQAWMDFTPGQGGDGGYFEDGNNQHKNDWDLLHKNGWITQETETNDDFDDTPSVPDTWTQNAGIYSNVRNDEDLGDATGPKGAWCVQAGERGGFVSSEDSRGLARCYRWFDLDDYIYWDRYTVTRTRVWLDYKIESGDFNNNNDFVIFTAYIGDGNNNPMLEHFKTSGDPLAGSGGKCIDFWDVDDQNSGTTDPSFSVNDKLLDTLSGGGNLPNWFNNHAVNNREYVIVFGLQVRLYGGSLYNFEHFKFWLDDVQISFEYTAVDLSADITTNIGEGYAPMDVTFSPGTAGGLSPFSYAWNFKDGGTSDAAAPNHRFNNAGTYNVELSVTDSRGRETTDARTIIVHQPPSASIDAVAPNPATKGERVTMKGSMAGGWGPMSMVDWQFGDGATATGEEVGHTYSRSGTFTIKFRAKDSHDTYTPWVTETITVNREPEATIGQVAPNPATEGVTINFRGSGAHGTGTLSYLWEFGDGQSSTSGTATHFYSSHGAYTANFKVKDGHGIWSAPKTVTVNVNRAPVARIASVTPDPATATEQIAFEGEGSHGTGSYGYTWDFGDGSTSADRDPGHAYSEAGTYTVTLKIKDGQNVWSGEVSTDVSINERPGACVDSASPNPATLTEAVSLACTVSGGTGGITEYRWDMGDGNTHDREDPAHTYASAGTYTVKLKVKDGHGIWSEEADTVITVNPLPTAEMISMSPGPATVSAVVSFDGSGTGGTGGITGFLWEFGDGSSGETAAVTHAFEKEGKFTVSLKVKDSHGVWSEPARRELEVNPLPLAVIESISVNPATATEEISFVGTGSRGTGGIVEFHWDFGDSSSDPGSSPTHAYEEEGAFEARLKVKDSLGIWSDPAVMNIDVNPLPQAEIDTISPAAPSHGDEVSFSGSGTGGSGDIKGYEWQSSIDGKLSASRDFSTSELSVGIHTIYLRCTDSHGIRGDAAERQLVMKADPGAPTAAIGSISPGVVSYGESVSFKGSAKGGSNSYKDYMWRSELDGRLSSRAAFSLNNLSVGEHTIYFKAMDSKNRWSSEVTGSVTVEVDERAPRAEITLLDPNPAHSGVAVTFRGTGNDGTGIYIEYRWRSSLDGELSRSDIFTSGELSTGTHTIFFSVMDSDSLWSGAVTAELEIMDADSAPEARIKSIEPGTAVQGQDVSFIGSGAAESGSIVEYIWTSDIDGELFRGESATIGSISVGHHIISLVVKDSSARVSPPAQKVLVVMGKEGAPVAHIDNIDPNPAAEGENITFTGGADGGSGSYEEYSWRSGTTGRLSGKAGFSKRMKAGTHRIYFKVKDSSGLWSSEVETDLTVNSARTGLLAVLTVSPTVPLAGEKVTFRSGDHGANAAEFLFIYRSGASSGWITSSEASHVYTEPGSYVAGLRLRDAGGNEGDFIWIDVNVGEKRAEGTENRAGPDFSWYYMVILLIAGIAILLVLFFIIRKRGGRTERDEIIYEMEPQAVSMPPMTPGTVPGPLGKGSKVRNTERASGHGDETFTTFHNFIGKIPTSDGKNAAISPKAPPDHRRFSLDEREPGKLFLPGPSDGPGDMEMDTEAGSAIVIKGKWPEEVMSEPRIRGEKAPKIVGSSGPEEITRGRKAPKIIGADRAEDMHEGGEDDRANEVRGEDLAIEAKNTPLIRIKPRPVPEKKPTAGGVAVIKVPKRKRGEDSGEGKYASAVIRPKMPKEERGGDRGLSSRTRAGLDSLLKKYREVSPGVNMHLDNSEDHERRAEVENTDGVDVGAQGQAGREAKEWLDDLIKKHGHSGLDDEIIPKSIPEE